MNLDKNMERARAKTRSLKNVQAVEEFFFFNRRCGEDSWTETIP